MSNQFENPQVKKLDDVTETVETTEKKIERIADKAAGKSTNTSKKYDKQGKIFTN
jgi:hypothetical protein